MLSTNQAITSLTRTNFSASGTVRFFLDFLRAINGSIVDTRYLSLTPAQYLAIVMVIGGVWLWRKKLPS